MSTSPPDFRIILEQWICTLQAKRDALDQTITALRIIQTQASVIGADLQDVLAPLAKNQPGLFDQLESPDMPSVANVSSTLNGKYSGTHREKITQFFIDRKNQPTTNLEVRAFFGLSRGAVAGVFYDHKNGFEPVGITSSKKQQWRLLPELYERLKAGEDWQTARKVIKVPDGDNDSSSPPDDK